MKRFGKKGAQSGSSIHEEELHSDSAQHEEKHKLEAATRDRTVNRLDHQPETQDRLEFTGPWYPGRLAKRRVKRLKRALEERRAGLAAGTWEKPDNKLAAVRNRMRSKRPLSVRRDSSKPIGQLLVSVLGGSFSISRPYIVLELDGNEARTSTGKSKAPTWEGADFLLPMYDPTSDLRLFVFDDAAIHNESHCIGRVIIPLAAAAAPSAAAPATAAAMEPHDEEQEGDNAATAPAAASTPTPRGALAARPRCVQLLTNVLARVPDGLDVAHHHFCAAQLEESRVLPAEDAQELGSDEPPAPAAGKAELL